MNETEQMSFTADKSMPIDTTTLFRCRVEKLPKDQRDKYFEWETNGYLVLHDQDYNEQSYIFNDIQNFMAEHHILPIVIGYDDWSAGEIVSMCKTK